MRKMFALAQKSDNGLDWCAVSEKFYETIESLCSDIGLPQKYHNGRMPCRVAASDLGSDWQDAETYIIQFEVVESPKTGQWKVKVKR